MNIDFSRLKIDYEYRQKFYQSKQWRNLRNYKISENPLCELCEKENKLVGAIDVDHIIDIKDNPFLALEYENLQSLCKPCHSKKTMNDNKPYLVFQKSKIKKPYRSSLWDEL